MYAFRELSFDSMFRERDKWRRFSSVEENEDKLTSLIGYTEKQAIICKIIRKIIHGGNE